MYRDTVKTNTNVFDITKTNKNVQRHYKDKQKCTFCLSL